LIAACVNRATYHITRRSSNTVGASDFVQDQFFETDERERDPVIIFYVVNHRQVTESDPDRMSKKKKSEGRLTGPEIPSLNDQRLTETSPVPEERRPRGRKPPPEEKPHRTFPPKEAFARFAMISTVPPELAERTLALCHFRDVASFSQTCRRAYALVYRSADQYLWRTLFLRFPFDDPRLAVGSGDATDSGPAGLQSASPPPHLPNDDKNNKVDWRAKLQRRVRAERIARRDGDRREVVGVLLECIREAAAPRGMPSSSHNLSWVTKVLTLEESPWIERFLRLEQLESPSPRRDLSSDVEELRAHLALSLDHGAGAEAPEKLRVLRRASRAHVYDLRNYSKEAHWGPFTDAGEHVNWSHVNAIVTVITMNLRDFGVHWPKEFKPQGMVQGLEACRPYSAPGSLKRSPHDWAGVEGQWMRVVCFCDYRYVSMSHSFPPKINIWVAP
jgi:hypothetical protein